MEAFYPAISVFILLIGYFHVLSYDIISLDFNLFCRS